MQYTFEDFKNTKIAVRISYKRQFVRFLDICDKYGVSFATGNSDAKEWAFDWKHRDVVLICRIDLLTWQDDDDPLPFDVRKCVHVNEVLCRPVKETKKEYCPVPDCQITITCWGDTTHADMFVNGHKVKETKAKRNPADKFNFHIGAQTAFNRLWEKKNQKPVVKEVKRYAKPGEWVKVVAAKNCHGETYKTGDVLQVKRVWMQPDANGWVYLEDHEECVCNPDEYVVLEGYKPE